MPPVPTYAELANWISCMDPVQRDRPVLIVDTGDAPGQEPRELLKLENSQEIYGNPPVLVVVTRK